MELAYFTVKEARACLFAGLFFAALFLMPRTGLFGIPRYDLLRLFMLGEEADLAPRHKVSLNRFLLGLLKGFRNLDTAAQGV